MSSINLDKNFVLEKTKEAIKNSVSKLKALQKQEIDKKYFSNSNKALFSGRILKTKEEIENDLQKDSWSYYRILEIKFMDVIEELEKLKNLAKLSNDYVIVTDNHIELLNEYIPGLIK